MTIGGQTPLPPRTRTRTEFVRSTRKRGEFGRRGAEARVSARIREADSSMNHKARGAWDARANSCRFVQQSRAEIVREGQLYGTPSS